MKSTSRALKTAGIGGCVIASPLVASGLTERKTSASQTRPGFQVLDVLDECIAVMDSNPRCKPINPQ